MPIFKRGQLKHTKLSLIPFGKGADILKNTKDTKLVMVAGKHEFSMLAVPVAIDVNLRFDAQHNQTLPI
jgi:hypothetical protein